MAGKHYSRDELQMIAALRARGLSIRTVAAQLGRTPCAIQNTLRARRWVDPTRSQTMSSVRIFRSSEQEAFREFVRSPAAGHTPTDIQEAWNKEAATKRWPTVNGERVTYYLRQLGLQKTKREYMQFESYRRRQSIAQRTRRSKEREARLRTLRMRRAELYARGSDTPRRCQVCGETWPLTEEFFLHAGSSAKYFLNTCKMCSHRLTGAAEERRMQRMSIYDHNVVIKQIAVAKAERDALLRQHSNCPTRRCSRCHEVWELLPKRFPTYKREAGGELYRKTCRFCLRASERLKARAKRGVVLSTVSCARRSVERMVRVAETSG